MTQTLVVHRGAVLRKLSGARLFLAVAAILWVAPVAYALATRIWTIEQGAQGPVILITGLWLLRTRLAQHAMLRAPGRLDVALAAMLPCLLLYVLASMVSMLTGALLATWAGLVVLLYADWGAAVLRRLWFPLAYLLFLIPPPVVLVDPTVQLLKRAIAEWAVESLAAFGFEVAARGSSLFIDQYELLVAAACSGMNSIFSLAAIGIFYVHVRHDDDWRRAALLALAIVPVALGTNLIRVILLLIAVHQWGARVLDTPLHMATGLAMAALALLLLVVLDQAIVPLMPHPPRARR